MLQSADHIGLQNAGLVGIEIRLRTVRRKKWVDVSGLVARGPGLEQVSEIARWRTAGFA